ncbi:MAG: hypothetical protein Q9159_004998 [Coniocarpon cinnabarinum]
MQSCSEQTTIPTSPLLELPHELRLQILTYATTSEPLTITTVPSLTPSQPNEPIPNLPSSHVPVLIPGYSRAALVTSLRGTQYGSSWPCNGQVIQETESAYPHTFSSLRAVCHTFYDDLSSPPWQDLGEGLELHLSYPGGLCAVAHHWPWLLRCARKVNIYGVFDCGAYRGPEPPHDKDPLAKGYLEDLERFDAHRKMICGQVDTLERLTSILVGCGYYEARHLPFFRNQPGAKLLLRIWYPQRAGTTDVYRDLWVLPQIPSLIALQAIPVGNIGFHIYRGRVSSGMEITAEAAPGPRPKERCVSSRFTLLPGAAWRGKQEDETWAVDGSACPKDRS